MVWMKKKKRSPARRKRLVEQAKKRRRMHERLADKLIKEDRALADKITILEAAYAENQDDFQTVMQLGRLYAITSLSPKKRIAFLKKPNN